MERPDIRIPVNNRRSLEGLVKREFTDYGSLVLRGSWDSKAEQAQCLVNVDNLLDHWPDGRQRPEVSQEQTDEALRRLAQSAIAA